MYFVSFLLRRKGKSLENFLLEIISMYFVNILKKRNGFAVFPFSFASIQLFLTNYLLMRDSSFKVLHVLSRNERGKC